MKKEFLKTALLISTYNWPQALSLVFESITLQTVFPDEILIADDGSTEETTDIIKKWQQNFKIPIKHVWHRDEGFRKTIIMNKAVAGTDAEYIIQIDGDIILEKHFIEDHLSEKKEGFYIKGSRALISERATNELLNAGKINWQTARGNKKNSINATRNKFLSHFLIKESSNSHDLKGCNFSFWKSDFVKVNGYNNDINGWGHEDIELAARLTNLGVRQRRVKLKAVCFHLHHAYFDRKNEPENYNEYEKVLREKIIRCDNGLNEL